MSNEHVEVLREMRDDHDNAGIPEYAAALDAAIASLSAPQSDGEWVLVPKDAIERAIETLENDGDEHGEGRNLRAMLDAALQPPAEVQGGGDMTECGHSKYDPCHNCEPLDAPPSAPVGVEAAGTAPTPAAPVDCGPHGVIVPPSQPSSPQPWMGHRVTTSRASRTDDMTPSCGGGRTTPVTRRTLSRPGSTQS